MAVGGSKNYGRIPTNAPARLDKDRRMFRFGHRVDAIIVANATAQNRLIDVQVDRDPTFYWPENPITASDRVALTSESYFYLMCPANSTTVYDAGFFADRGLKIKSQNSPSVFVSVVADVKKAECEKETGLI